MMRWLPIAALLGCSAPPTVSVLVIRGEGTPELSDLTRLRLVVRTCDEQVAVAQNLPLDDPEKIEAPLIPGTNFYVWLQGFEACNPPCVPEADTNPEMSVCTCYAGEDPTEQIMTYEACTNWLAADADIRRTLTLSPRAEPPLCPPPALAESECVPP